MKVCKCICRQSKLIYYINFLTTVFTMEFYTKQEQDGLQLLAQPSGKCFPWNLPP